MEFSEFAQRLKAVIGGAEHTGEFVRVLFQKMLPEGSAGQLSLSEKSESALRKMFSGISRIGRLSKIISKDMDRELFISYLDSFSDDVRQRLLNEFSDELPQANVSDVTELVADLFVDIIQEAAKRKQVRKQKSAKPVEPIAVSEGQLLHLVLEAGRYCPLCHSGKLITATKRSERLVARAVAIKASAGDTYDDDNLIALCPNCAAEYNTGHDPDEERKLLAIKTRLKASSFMQDKLSYINIDDELRGVIDALPALRDAPSVDRSQLEMLAHKVEEKIPDDHLLMEEVRGLVTRYYHFIQEELHELSSTAGLDSDYLAGQMRHAYRIINASGTDKETAVDCLATWLQSKTGSSSRRACGIIIAFFIQSCEVFDATS